jgi:hypothetical protein
MYAAYRCGVLGKLSEIFSWYTVLEGEGEGEGKDNEGR